MSLLVLALLSITFALAFSGVIRTVSFFSLPLSLLLALPISLLCATIVGTSITKILRENALQFFLLVSVGVSYFLYTMYHPSFYGLVSSGGGDVADHIYYSYKFTNPDPAIYHGFIIFHTLLYWIKYVPTISSDFEALRALYYLFGFLYLSTITLLVLKGSAASKRLSRRTLLYLAAIVITYTLIFDRLLFPILSYLQAEGFYPQLFGILPLLLGAVLYGLEDVQWKRLTLLALTLVLYRWTYGLNLPDLVFALTLLVASEARGRTVQLLLLALGILLCAFLWLKLSVLLNRGGGIVPLYLPAIGVGLSSICLVLIALRRYIPLKLAKTSTFATFFSLPAIIVTTLAFLLGDAKDYYLLKYNFHATTLLISTAPVVLIAALCNSHPSSEQIAPLPRFKSLLLVALFFGGMYAFSLGYANVRAHYVERIKKDKDNTILEPLADPKAEELIQEVLTTKQKLFGGFVSTPGWVLSGVMNASFKYYHYRQERIHVTGKLRDDPGYCIFWNSRPRDLKKIQMIGSKKLSIYLKNLKKQSGTATLHYKREWEDEQAKLSYHCF